MIKVKDGMTVLFIGDSITDWYRDMQNPLGHGFALMVSALLGAKHPNMTFNFVNTGIGRNKTGDILDRWNYDCLRHNPDVIIMLVGVNDCLEPLFVDEDKFPLSLIKDNMCKMLDTVKDKDVILLEPFLNENSTKWSNPWGLKKEWIDENLKPIQEVIRDVAKKYNTYLIPLGEIFEELCKYGPDKWTLEGCHPTNIGHGVITNKIMELFD